jgi:hypothetical protein
MKANSSTISFDEVSGKPVTGKRRRLFLRLTFVVGIVLLLSSTSVPSCLACLPNLPKLVLDQPVEKKKSFLSKVKLPAKLLLAGATLTAIASLIYSLAYTTNELNDANRYIILLLTKCEKWSSKL